MATPVGRIESEFLLAVIFNEKIPIIYIKDRIEYSLLLDRPPGEELVFRSDKPLCKLKSNVKLPLLFDYRGQVVDFSVEVMAQKDGLLYCRTPNILHKNLDRDYLRVGTPSDLKIRFTFLGDRYNLSFPKVNEYEKIGIDDLIKSLDPKNLSSLIKQISGSCKNFSDGFKIVNFKDKKPETSEERIVSETGKTLFIPSTSGSFPKTDPYPKKRIITEELFKRYLESTGVGSSFLADNCSRFLKSKLEEGIYSDVWVPILFHEYVIGYIHLWIVNQARLPFDFGVIDKVYQYAKVLAFSLKENGYFDYGKVNNEPFDGRVLDISVSGLLFACPPSLLATLLVGSDLTVSIDSPDRSVNVTARIVRRFKDRTAGYLGCRFLDMAPEDKRFLFEYLYGRQIDDKDSCFLSGQV